jgi:hypothetical protein
MLMCVGEHQDESLVLGTQVFGNGTITRLVCDILRESLPRLATSQAGRKIFPSVGRS